MVMGADHLPLMTSRGGRDGGRGRAAAAHDAVLVEGQDAQDGRGAARAAAGGRARVRRRAEVLRGESAKDCKLNARYAISCAHKMGCKVFTSWEDIVECKPKMIMCLVCAAMAEDIRRRKAAGLTPRATPRR